jgi:ATP-dependent helicase HrpA
VASSSGAEPEPEIWKRAQAKWEKTGITSWNFDPLPERIPLGPHLIAYPGLEAGDGVVNIRLFRSYEAALTSHKNGVQALFSIRYAKDLKFLKKTLRLSDEGAQGARYFGGESRVERALFRSVVKSLFHQDLRDRKAFDAHAEKVGHKLLAKGNELRDQAILVMNAYRRTREAIHTVEKANETNKDVLTLCSDIREDLNTLIPEDFVDRYPIDRLVHLPRYLKAMEKRGERGAHDPSKDRNKMAQAAVFIKAFNNLSNEMSPHASGEKREALESFRWMVEEFKVSLFAQELKTPYPVSKKRLQEKQKEIERMV